MICLPPGMSSALLIVLAAAAATAAPLPPLPPLPAPGGGARAMALAQAEIVPAVRISSRSQAASQAGKEPRRHVRRLASGRTIIEFE